MEYANKFEKMVKESIGKKIGRKKAIRYKCLDCCCYQVNEVRMCTCTDFPLYRYRLGTEEKEKNLTESL